MWDHIWDWIRAGGDIVLELLKWLGKYAVIVLKAIIDLIQMYL